MATDGEKSRKVKKSQEIFEITRARQAVLDRPAIESLKLVEKINAIEVNKDYKAQFQKLFTGLGKLDGAYYVIKLKPEAKPLALTTPRRVPVPSFRKSKKNLHGWSKCTSYPKLVNQQNGARGMVVDPKANIKV